MVASHVMECIGLERRSWTCFRNTHISDLHYIDAISEWCLRCEIFKSFLCALLILEISYNSSFVQIGIVNILQRSSMMKQQLMQLVLPFQDLMIVLSRYYQHSWLLECISHWAWSHRGSMLCATICLIFIFYQSWHIRLNKTLCPALHLWRRLFRLLPLQTWLPQESGFRRLGHYLLIS